MGYNEQLLPKLIRKFISLLYQILGAADFPEPDHSGPDRSSSSEFHSYSAVILKEILPILQYQDLEEKDTDHQENCAVCLSEFDGEDEIRRLGNCRHIFHRDCLDRWMDHDQKTCPLCRTSLVPVEMHPDFCERLSIATGIPEEYYSN